MWLLLYNSLKSRDNEAKFAEGRFCRRRGGALVYNRQLHQSGAPETYELYNNAIDGGLN